MNVFGFERVYYADTDSVFSDKRIIFDGDWLGSVKLEKESNFSFLFRPKFYVLEDEVVCKGLNFKLEPLEFIHLLQEGVSSGALDAIMRLREGARRQISPLTEFEKKFSLNLYPDAKRRWLKGLFGKELLLGLEESCARRL